MSRAKEYHNPWHKTRLKLERHHQFHWYYNVPDEVWFEILSRLPIKSLLICQWVCKSWRNITSYVKNRARRIRPNGLLFNSTSAPSQISYYSYKLNKVFILNSHSLGSSSDNNHQEFTVPSGFRKGLLSDLCFDFGGVVNAAGSFVATDNKGLFLVVDDDNTCQVHNPATKQVFTLPKSTLLKSNLSDPHEKAGFIWNRTGTHVNRRLCTFWVIRIRLLQGLIEWFTFPCRQRWDVRRITMNRKLRKASWFYENYVILPDSKTLYLLTDKIVGVAININKLHDIKLQDSVDCKMFRLPDVVRKEYCKNARLGKRLGESCLNLSYYSVENGAWLWRLEESSLKWIPMFMVNKNAGQLCKSLGEKRLLEFLEAGDTVIPWAFYITPGIIFLSIKSCIYVYNLHDHSLRKVTKLGKDYKLTSSPYARYIPCLASLQL